MTRRAVLLLNQVVDKQMAEMSPTQIKEWRDYFWKISLLLFPGGFIAGLAKGGGAGFVFGVLAGFAGLLCTLIAHLWVVNLKGLRRFLWLARLPSCFSSG